MWVDYYRYQVFKDNQLKLYDPDLLDNFDKDINFIDTQLNDDDIKNIIIDMNDENINLLEQQISKYKLTKKIRGEENDTLEFKLNEIGTYSQENITKEDRNLILYTLVGIINTGKIWNIFTENYNMATVFYAKKKKLLPANRNNLRCLVNSDNRLKVLQRYLKDYIIDEIFAKQLVNTDIHQAKKCRIIDKQNDMSKLVFEHIATLGNKIHNSAYKSGKYGFILLDMTNAYNNVKYDFLNKVLFHYLSKIHNNDMAANLANGITRLIKQIKFWDPNIKEYLLRNKGVPQGCPISMDLYVLCMDYIFTEIINILATDELGNLHLGVDYDFQVYVDDIFISINTQLGFNKAGLILQKMREIFEYYYFKININKSCCTFNLVEVTGLSEIKSNHKYLGIYMESEPEKYLKLLEEEFKCRFPHNSLLHTFQSMNNNVNRIFRCKNRLPNNKNISIVRGKLNYRLTPFCNDNISRNKFMSEMGYNNLAQLLW